MDAKHRVGYEWDAETIRALRQHMGLSQQQMSDELGVRQQTVSEWETGIYRPRGGMCRLLSLVAERAGFTALDVSAQEIPDRRSLLRQPVAWLGLKPRAVRALHEAGVDEVRQVLDAWQQGKSTLLAIPGFGPRSLKVLEKALRDHGLIY